jgi:large subunit ribosomal protein L10e
MGLRPARIYRDMDSKMPYTRRAVRVHNKDFIRGVPGSKMHQFDMGTKGKYEVAVHLFPRVNTTLRHNALDAARIAANAFLKKKLENAYFLKVKVYPHHVMRAHAQAAVAQADRFYQGMSHPFGKPVGVAARVRTTQAIMTAYVAKKDLEFAKDAMRRAGDKLSNGTRMEIEVVA